MQITILQNLLEANEKKAAEIRAFLRGYKILMLNLISSPGAGKTTLLEKTLPRLTQRYRIAVIEGDVETARDAARLVRYNVPVSLVNTQGGCHLESVSIEKALAAFNLNELDLIFIENVGNLVCPAEFDLGEDAKVAVMSTPEGDDKVMKYPLLFRESELVLLNKIDLLSATDFKRDVFYTDLKQVNAAIKVIEISCKNGAGLDQWLEWLERKIAAKKQAQ